MPKQRESYHVVPYVNGWEIRRAGAGKDHGSLGTWDHKDLALARAKELAKQADLGQVVIHGQDGEIQEEYTYGDDPRNIPG
jgi:hypothetical protein